jgi:hypothetical protein
MNINIVYLVISTKYYQRGEVKVIMAIGGVPVDGVFGGGKCFCGIAIVVVIILLLIALGIVF